MTAKNATKLQFLNNFIVNIRFLNNGTLFENIHKKLIIKKYNHKMAKVEFLTEETFKTNVFNYEKNKDWKFEGDLPCIIDFYADWCRPCKMVAPILEELQTEYEGKIKIYKIDTEDQRKLSAMFGIQSIPSLLFVPKEGQPQMATGAMPKENFKQAIADVLKVTL